MLALMIALLAIIGLVVEQPQAALAVSAVAVTAFTLLLGAFNVLWSG